MTLAFHRLHAMAVVLVVGFLASWTTSALSQSNATIDFGSVGRDRLINTYKVDVRALNFRDGPNLTGETVSIVQEDEFLLEIDRTFNRREGIEWIKVVRSDGQEGWVSSRYVTPITESVEAVEGAVAFLSRLSQPDPKSSLSIAERNDSIRAGFIYSGTIGDAGWTYQHDLARQSLEQLSFVETTSFIESVPEEAELVSEAIDKLVEEGSNLIFTTSFGFMDPTVEAGKRHPDVVFMHSSGYKTWDNVGTYFGKIYQARYLSGIVAGAMAKSGEIGYIAAFPIPQVIRGINAFTLGAQSVNPDVNVTVRWTNTWYGPGIELEIAEALLDLGADVLTIHQNSPAAIQAAQSRGKFAIGFHSDMSIFGPEATLTSAIWDWGVIYRQIAFEMREGVWDPEQLWWGLDKGVVGLAPLSDQVPADIKDLVEQQAEEIANRARHVFTGPIRDTKGDVRVGSGNILSDADLLTMDYYVLGVKGGIPPSTSSASDEGEAN